MRVPKKAILLIPAAGVGCIGTYYSYTQTNKNREIDLEVQDEETPVNDPTPEQTLTPEEPKKSIEIEPDYTPSDESWKTESIRDKFPYEENFIIDQIEDLRRYDPVRYRYFYNKPKGRKIDLKRGMEQVEIMRDHTMMILGCNQYGTGWILDYVLPDESKGEKYPTRWFIASNAHVYNVIPFDRTNPYDQFLNDMNLDEGCSIGSGVTLVKERVDQSPGDFYRANWKGNAGIRNYMSRLSIFFDVSKWRNKEPSYENQRWWYKDKNPKLFYFPYQMLGTDSRKWPGRKFKDDNYSVDFAIMEVNFETETMAKLFTRNFYNKYDRVKGSRKNKALNFFARPIAEKYSEQQILEKDVQAFGVGYPRNGIANKATSNYDADGQKGSRLTYYRSVHTSPTKAMLGHTDFSYVSEHANYNVKPNVFYTWGGKNIHKRGYGYSFGDHWLFSGASGTLFAEEDGDVLGVFSSSNNKYNIGMVEPLRNQEIRDENGVVIAPAYDIMEGVQGQEKSYRSQIEKYVLKYGKQTALSRLRKWSYRG